MKAVFGYIISVVGLVIMTIGFGAFNISLFSGVGEWYVAGVGAVLVAVGVIISLSDKGGSRKHKQAKEEVPIYEGTGKNRKIVGYQRE